MMLKTASAVLVVCAFYAVQGQRFRTVESVPGAPAAQSKSVSNARTANAVLEPTPKSPTKPASAYNCPEENGRFPTGQCDSYIECIDGVGEEKLCADGLLFNAAVSPHAFPCQYPIDVDCIGRSGTQEPQPTADCPHQYGYYKLGDETDCGQFKNCVAGRAFTFDCPEGLAFSEDTYRCDWPDQVSTCNAEAFLGFTCPEVEKSFFVSAEYRFFKSDVHCQKYFICIDGKPRAYNCPGGEAFNEFTNTCDDIENVTGCAPEYVAKYDTKKSVAINLR